MNQSGVTGHCRTHVGKVRDHNEDHFFEDPCRGLWIIADGMGGHESGEVASELACHEIPDLIAKGESAANAIRLTHHRIKQAPAERQLGTAGMGTTVVLAQFNQHHFTLNWVGDSRAYLYADGTLSQLTRDHSYVQHLLDMGAITAEEALIHPERNIITQSLGSDSVSEVKVDEVSGVLHHGEKLMLCSDGLTGEVTDEDIQAILMAETDSATAVNQLIEAANHNGGSDNITIAIIDASSTAPARPARTITRKIHAIKSSEPTRHGRWLAASIGALLALLIIVVFWPPKETQTVPANGDILSSADLSRSKGADETASKEVHDILAAPESSESATRIEQVTSDQALQSSQTRQLNKVQPVLLPQKIELGEPATEMALPQPEPTNNSDKPSLGDESAEDSTDRSAQPKEPFNEQSSVELLPPEEEPPQ